MTWSRREFLYSALSAATVFPLAGKGLTSDVFLPPNPSMQDNTALLNELERTAFEYFWNEASPRTGLVRDRALADGGDTRNLASVAATGFGLTALCIGYERGYRSQHEIKARVQSSLRFLAEQAPHVHGFFYHFVDMETGTRIRNSEISPIDMAIFLCGVLTCRAYFDDPEIRRNAELLYNRVNWTWALNKGTAFAMAWRPESGFSAHRWDSYCESMMLYLLAMGSPTHPIPNDCWNSIRRPWMTYANLRFISSPAPLFVHQFSHAWFDFRGKQDEYTNYFENSVLASQAHQRFCEELNRQFPCYSKKVWGITASDSRKGYVAWGGPPMQGPIDGTIVPAAAAGSLPFVFNDAVGVLKNLRSYYGDKIWKRYGFVDAFNPLTGWVSRDVLGIDVGISMLMAENARSQFVWNTFMKNPEVKVAMDRASFRPLGEPMLASATAKKVAG
jgi:hypothetical protein